MILHHNEKDISERIKAAEKADLEAFCKENGFTETETAEFVKNSLENLYKDEADE